jgi:hypothetical protein
MFSCNLWETTLPHDRIHSSQAALVLCRLFTKIETTRSASNRQFVFIVFRQQSAAYVIRACRVIERFSKL